MASSSVLCRLCDKSVPITGTRGVACFTKGVADDRVHLRYMYKYHSDVCDSIAIPLDASSELSTLITEAINGGQTIHHPGSLQVADIAEVPGPCVFIPIVWRRQSADEGDEPVEKVIGVMLYWGIRSGVRMSGDDVRVAELLARQTSSLLVEERLADIEDVSVALTNVPVGLLLLDHVDRIVLINPMAEEVLQHRHTYDHHCLGEVDHGEQLSSLVAACRASKEGWSSASFTTKTGESLSATAQIAKDGECVVALSRAHLSNSAEQMVGQVAHELRTPLTSIQGSVMTVDAIIEAGLQPGDEEVLREMLHVAQVQCNRMTRLISETLNVSRIQAGREVEIRKAPMDLAEVSREIIAELHDTLSGHELVADIPGRCQVEADRDKMASVLDNLLRNAIKYSEPETAIEFTITEDCDQIHISVTDHGIGIPPEDMEKIGRDPGFRTSVSQRHAGGIGLGMVYVRRVVEGHGGRLDIGSVLGEGSTFTVSLPRGDTQTFGFSP